MINWRIISLFARRSSSLVSPAADLNTQRNPAIVTDGNLTIDSSSSLSHGDILKESIPRRRRYAMLLCYHGLNYFGMQYNCNRPSIEAALFNAFRTSGIFTDDELYHSKFSIGFNRGSRTDSGVSALRQVVSLTMPVDTNIEMLNQHLPPDIRILGLKRTTGNFDAQGQCSSRSYCYVMPTFALCPHHKIATSYNNYRVDADTLLKAKQVFERFIGCHRFHNYTERRDMWDQRSARMINEVSVSNAFLFGNLEMVQFHIRGASFMLHQIRRMIGVVIAIMREQLRLHHLIETLESPVFATPTAPALGLMLEKQHYDLYNKKFGHVREPLEWNECDEGVEKFKMEFIVPHIVKTELEEKSMKTFLSDNMRRYTPIIAADTSRRRKLEDWDVDDLEAAIIQSPVVNIKWKNPTIE